MSGQQQGTYDPGVPSGPMGGLAHTVDNYLNEMSSAQSGHNVVPQPRGQSLQHRAGGTEYSHQPNVCYLIFFYVSQKKGESRGKEKV